MNKAEVKLLTESDSQLQWWAGSVLFAEISELVDARKCGHSVESIYNCIEMKVDEFSQLVIQRAREQAKEKLDKKPTLEELEERVAKSEEAIGDKISARSL